MRLMFSKKIWSKIFWICTWLLVAGYLISLGGWFFSVEVSFLLGLSSLVFVWFWLLVLVWSILLIFQKNKRPAFLFALLWLAGWAPGFASLSLGVSHPFLPEKKEGSIRVMQWNCMALPGNVIDWFPFNKERKQVASFIMQYQPDIICMQDFTNAEGRIFNSNISFIKDTLGYPYQVIGNYAKEIKKYGKITFGTAIFSKKPLINHGISYYKNRSFSEAIVYGDVLLDGKPLRIVTTHFRSMNLFIDSAGRAQKLPYYQKEDSAIIRSYNIFKKIRFYQQEHLTQARELRYFLDTCQIPVIFCSDLNTVPANYIYSLLKKDKTDGFIGSAFGMGETYNQLAPNIRIDYIFHDKKLSAFQWKHFENGFFDHDHLMGDFEWK